jgi:hypothetical protein
MDREAARAANEQDEVHRHLLARNESMDAGKDSVAEVQRLERLSKNACAGGDGQNDLIR